MFEFDPAKSIANAAKHGIDFEKAQALWLDNRRIEARVARDDTEERSIVFGQIDDRLWTAVITYRQGRIRIISVRRSRDREREDYFRRGV